MGWYNGYDAWDWTSTSYNEGKRNEYKKAKKKLSEYLEEIDKYIAEAERQFSNFKTVYSYDAGFKGSISDGFENKSIQYEVMIKGYINRIKGFRNTIAKRKERCETLYNQYLYACEEEDRIGRAEWEANH